MKNSQRKKKKKKIVAYGTYKVLKSVCDGNWKDLFLFPIMLLIDAFRLILLFMRFVLVILLIVLAVLFVLGLMVWNQKLKPIYTEWDTMAKEVVSESNEDTFRPAESSYIYDSTGHLLAKLQAANDATYLQYNDIPRYAIDAYVAIEDRSYWDNPGYDVKGIVRVGLNYLKTHGEEAHGASTITQQVARNTFLTREVSIERKGKEILISKYLTDKYSKQDIMEFYVNNICYSNGIYGLEAAANTYFGKKANECSLAEIAYLCAIPNSPAYYDPYVDVSRPIERQNKILRDMLELKYITQSEYNEAVSQPITLTEKKAEAVNGYQATYAIDCAIRTLMREEGFEFEYVFHDWDVYTEYMDAYSIAYSEAREKLYSGGYKIYTSLDTSLQREVQLALDEELAFSQEMDLETGIFKLQGAVTVLDVETNKVVAIVGGRTQIVVEPTGLNRAFQSYRQPGSSIKPLIVYATALEHGYTPNTMVTNISVDAAKEKGANVQELSGDTMTLQRALTWSKNGVSWKLFDQFGSDVCMKHLTDMHYSKITPNDYYNSSSLGGFTYGVTTVEQASAYRTLANHGQYSEPTCITKMVDRNGVEVPLSEEVIKAYLAKPADTLIEMLQEVTNNGTAASMHWSSSSPLPAACKTGTTNGSKDGWLCGVTPLYSVAVWVGYDQPQTLNNLWGNTYPAKIWKRVMLAATDGAESVDFVVDETLYEGEELLSGGVGQEYLPGRDDNELLSDNYYVRDYRNDRVIGESVQSIINQLNAIPPGDSSRETLYNEGKAIIETIYSRKYTAEMTAALDAAYGGN